MARAAATASVALVLMLGVLAGMAIERHRWAWFLNEQSAWTVVHLKDGGTASYTWKDGTLTYGGVTTAEEHRRMNDESTAQMELWAKRRDNYLIAEPTPVDVAAFLVELAAISHEALAMVGVEGEDGAWRPLTAADLERCR